MSNKTTCDGDVDNSRDGDVEISVGSILCAIGRRIRCVREGWGRSEECDARNKKHKRHREHSWRRRCVPPGKMHGLETCRDMLYM